MLLVTDKMDNSVIESERIIIKFILLMHIESIYQKRKHPRYNIIGIYYYFNIGYLERNVLHRKITVL